MPRSDNVGRAVKQLLVAVLRSPTLEVVLSATLVHALAWMGQLVTGYKLWEPVLFAVGFYDLLAVLVAGKVMLRRLLQA